MSVIGRNLVWLFISQVLTWAVSIVILIVAPRRLGPTDFGLLSFVTSYVAIFAFVGVLGTGAFITRAVARDPDLLTSYVYNGLALKCATWIVVGGAAVGLGFILGYPPTTMILIALAVVGLFFILLNDVIVGGLAGLNRLARPAMWSVIQIYLSSALVLLVLVTNHGVVALSFVVTLTVLVPTVANGRNVWRLMQRHRRRIELSVWNTLVRGGLPLMVLGGLILLYGTIDVPLLEAMTNSAEVGEYVLAYRWVGVPVFVAAVVVNAVAPTLSSLAHTSRSEFVELANRSLRGVMAVSMPAAAGIFVIAYQLIDLLYRDQGFDDSALLIRILAVHIPLAALSTVLGAVLIASDRQNRYVRVALIAAISNPPMTVALIALTKHVMHDGAIGAAIATVLTECFMCAGAYALQRDGVFDRSTTLYGGRVVLACVVMALPLLIADGLNIFVKIAAGVILYGLAAFALGVLKPAEVRSSFDQLRSARRSPSDNSTFDPR